jgi:hypothetical protein
MPPKTTVKPKTAPVAKARPAPSPGRPLDWIPVKQLRFTSAQDGEGISVASSLTACHGKSDYRNRKHRVFYMPEANHMRMEFYPGPGKPYTVQYVPMNRIMVWTPFRADEEPSTPWVPDPTPEPEE